MKLSECVLCSLCKTRKQVVCGVGNGKSGVMLVGEAPGRTENDQGIPFVGKAGQLLRDSIQDIWRGDPDMLYITNVVKCWPPNPDGNGNRTPTPQEIDSCTQWLELEIKTKKPLVIVPLGNTALKAITGGDGITTKHGQIAWEPKHSTYVYPMFHPSFILRTGSVEEFQNDCIRLGHMLNRSWLDVELWIREKVRVV